MSTPKAQPNWEIRVIHAPWRTVHLQKLKVYICEPTWSRRIYKGGKFGAEEYGRRLHASFKRGHCRLTIEK